MRKLLLIILAFTLFGEAQAQPMRMLLTKRVVSGTTTYYMLDSNTSYAGYSVRRLKTGADSCVRIRRSSDDAFQIIGFLSDGFFDTTSFKTFVGANTGYVQTWYNQVDHALDATKGTAGEQPILQLNVFGNKPAVIFDGTNDALDIDANAAYETPTFFAVDSVGIAAGGENGHFFYFTNAASASYYPFVNEQIYDAFGSTTRQSAGTPPSAVRAKHLYYVKSQPGQWENYINNSLIYLVESNTTNTSSDMFIGYGGVYFKGAISEIIISDGIDLRSSINWYYNIY